MKVKKERIFSIVCILVGVYGLLASGLYLHGIVENPAYWQIGLISVMICTVVNLIISIRKKKQNKEKPDIR